MLCHFSLCLIELLLVACLALANDPSSANVSLTWGPYRPNLYFGLRPTVAESLSMGLMWSNADDATAVLKSLRHTCEQNEGMASYGWTDYDARLGGRQVINDTENSLDLVIDFVKASDASWTARISGSLRSDAPADLKTSLVFYLGNEDPTSETSCPGYQPDKVRPIHRAHCVGSSATVPQYDLKIYYSGQQKVHTKSLNVPPERIWEAKSFFSNLLEDEESLDGTIPQGPGHGNLHFIQAMLQGPFEAEIEFSSDTVPRHITAVSHMVDRTLNTFDDRFSAAFQPQAPFSSVEHRKFSKSLLSNLMGGIGFFHGKSKVSTTIKLDTTPPASREVIEEWGPYTLLSSVPSRPFFPRGFLWDEGFHLQVIMDYDIDLAMLIVANWFDLMNDNGWIAREQILGLEARSKVPSEFQTQYQHYANPPILFLVVQAFAQMLDKQHEYKGTASYYLSNESAGHTLLADLYTKLKKHYSWWTTSQASTTESRAKYGERILQGYRWRGKTLSHTLTSGLDDYPRAKSLSDDEMNVDALSWVGVMDSALFTIAAQLGKDAEASQYLQHLEEVKSSIDQLHWSDDEQAYCDATIQDEKALRICHKGYISLFPFFTGLLATDHSHLPAMLELIKTNLWSAHGIRSLSPDDEYYGRDENYWRGPVWININYMILQQLQILARGNSSALQRQAGKLYTDLRRVLGHTVFGSWKDTGFVWEQYNPDTGKGQRTQHFTGWTALVVKVLAMSDQSGEITLPGHRYQRTGQISIASAAGMILIVGAVAGFCFRRQLLRSSREWWTARRRRDRGPRYIPLVER